MPFYFPTQKFLIIQTGWLNSLTKRENGKDEAEIKPESGKEKAPAWLQPELPMEAMNSFQKDLVPHEKKTSIFVFIY